MDKKPSEDKKAEKEGSSKEKEHPITLEATERPAEAPVSDEKVNPTVIEQEMQSSYLDYAMSVIIGRALPDVLTELLVGAHEAMIARRAGWTARSRG